MLAHINVPRRGVRLHNLNDDMPITSGGATDNHARGHHITVIIDTSWSTGYV